MEFYLFLLCALCSFANGSNIQSTEYMSLAVNARVKTKAKVCWPDFFIRSPSLFDSCDVGQELSAGKCLLPCPPGYQANGLNCIQICPSDYTDSGLMCSSSLFTFAKGVISRTAVSLSGCSGNKLKINRQCYDPCPTGYSAQNIVCMVNCSADRPFKCGFGCTDTKANCDTSLTSLTEFYALSKVAANGIAGLGGVPFVKAFPQQSILTFAQVIVKGIELGMTLSNFLTLAAFHSKNEGEDITVATVAQIYNTISLNGGVNYVYNPSHFTYSDTAGIGETILGLATDYCSNSQLPIPAHAIKNTNGYYISITDSGALRPGINVPIVSGFEGMTIEYNGGGSVFISRELGGNKLVLSIDDNGSVQATTGRNFKGFEELIQTYHSEKGCYTFQRAKSPNWYLSGDAKGNIRGSINSDVNGAECWYINL